MCYNSPSRDKEEDLFLPQSGYKPVLNMFHHSHNVLLSSTVAGLFGIIFFLIAMNSDDKTRDCSLVPWWNPFLSSNIGSNSASSMNYVKIYHSTAAQRLILHVQKWTCRMDCSFDSGNIVLKPVWFWFCCLVVFLCFGFGFFPPHKTLWKRVKTFFFQPPNLTHLLGTGYATRKEKVGLTLTWFTI